MSPEKIKLLKVGDIVTDRITGAKFSVVEVKSDSVFPIYLKLITDITEPIYLNLKAYTSTCFTEIGEEFWVFSDYQVAYKYYLPCEVCQGRRILTCEDLVLKSTSSWIEPKEPTEEIEEESDLISLSKVKQLKKARYAEDLKTINKLIQGNFMVCDLVVVTSRSLRNKVDDKGLIELIKKAGYEVESREDSLVIRGW
nr:MAG TPA: hypothetical protein [Caudoviricetes sp.]